MLKKYWPPFVFLSFCLCENLIADDESLDFSLDTPPEPVISAPGPTKPVYSSKLELGGNFVSEDSFKFGEYSGQQNRGGYVIGNLQILQRAAPDSGSTDYWKLDGINLGLSSREIRGEYGRQGKAKIFFEYNQTPHYRWDDAKTPFIVEGSTYNLPSGWVPSTSTAGMDKLNDSLNPISIATERKKYRGGVSWHFSPAWSAKLNYFHEKKDGFDVVSGIFGTNGGNPAAAILPRPIDYDTNDVSAELSYGNLRSQFNFRYHLSLFENIDALTWQNPYQSAANRPDTAYPDQGRLGLEPDNQAHQISFDFAHRFDNTMRLTGKFSYGWMLQDQSFLPYTVNPTLSASIPLPRNSLDAEVNTLHGNLTLTARPFRKTNIKARYTYNERDNQTPTDIYTILRNDSENQDNAAGSAEKRINQPYNYRKHKTQFELGYRLFSTAKLTAGYDFEHIERDYAEVSVTDEHTGRLKLTASPFTFMNSRLEYAHSIRNGSKYRHNKLFVDSHTTAYINTLPPELQFTNNPLLRKFQYSDRIRDDVNGNLSFLASEKVTLSLSGHYTHDNFDALFGLSDQTRISGTFDINYAFSDAFDLHGFYTQEYFLSRQNGFARTSASAALPPLNPDGFWHIDNEDTVHTVGAGLNWNIIDNKLDIGLDYLFSQAVTEIDPSRNTPVVDLPNINTVLHSLNLHGDYRFQPNLRLRLNYRYESLETADFARDAVMATAIPNVISLGSSSPDYSAHVFGLSMIYNF